MTQMSLNVTVSNFQSYGVFDWSYYEGERYNEGNGCVEILNSVQQDMNNLSRYAVSLPARTNVTTQCYSPEEL